MYVGRDFDPSDVGESELYCFDFVRDLQTGDTVTAAVWTCAVAAISEGTDAEASTRIDGDATFQGTKTFQRITGLQPGVIYRIQAIVSTQKGDEVSLWSHVESQPAAVQA